MPAHRTSSQAAGARSPLDIWLDGNSLICACPDCAAPISIRMWLLMADCWQCGCSVELTSEQERSIKSILGEEPTAETRQHAARQHSAHQIPAAHLPVAPPRPSSPRPTSPRRHSVSSHEAPLSLPGQARPVPPQVATRWSWRDTFRQMPAWLVSMLFHMVLLALFALMIFEGDQEDPYIVLSIQANRMHRQGGEVQFQNPLDTFEYDLPVPPEDQPKTPQQERALAQAAQDAKALQADPNAALPQLPDVRQVKQRLRSSESIQRTLAARDPRVRVEMVRREGGTTLTEAAVARGLHWMAEHQSPDGSWSLHRFNKLPQCGNRCRGHGSVRSDSAATALCLLPFLGASQTHQTGIYQSCVSKGLRWLLNHQRPDGDLRADSQGNAGMYAHGQAAIVLCEAYALSRDEQLRTAAQAAIDFIVNSQHADGGWRYKPGDEGDTSVLGWQLMALQSARAAGLTVPDTTLALTTNYLDSVSYDDGSRYSYQPNRRPTHVMTAEALLCRMYLGWKKDFAGLEQGVRYLRRKHMPNAQGTNFYYWYYATQVMHHFGGKPWEQWNLQMRDILVESQVRRGHAAGSWDPRGGHASQAGRLYSTAMAVCTLEVYYRHAPIFRQIELD